MANEVLSAIESRRSIRAYTNENLTDAQIALLAKAAVESPSAVNRQPYHFTFVRDGKLLADFNADFNALAARDDPAWDTSFNVYRGAPCCCFIFADPQNHFSPVDCGIAVENLALAAHSMGLGSVILGMPRRVFENGAENWEKALACPEGYKFVIAIGLGVPATTKDAHPVKEGLITLL